MGEFERIARLRTLLQEAGAPASPDRVLLGPGDDAAVLAATAGDLVLSVDSQQEDVHFRRAWLTEADLAFRALAAALSDLPAMGAEPVATLVSATLPADVGDEAFDRLARGLAEASAHFATPIVGGNLSAGPALALHTTVVGELPTGHPPVTRHGARAGDLLLVLGRLGAAAVGLEALQQGRQTEPLLAPFVARWRRPAVEPRWREVVRAARAAIDVSDGLLADARHLAEAAGLDLEVWGEPLPTLPEHEAACRRLGLDPLKTVLRGGEDYALLLAWDADDPVPPSAVAIGRFEPPADPRPGLWLRHPDGRRHPLPASGWDHFPS